MLKSNAAFVRGLVMFTDLLLVLLGFVAALYIRFQGEPSGYQFFPEHAAFVLGALPLWHFGLRQAGAYLSLREKTAWAIFLQVGKVAGFMAIIQMSVFYAFQLGDISRGVTLLFPLMAGTFLFLFRLFGMSFLGRFRAKGYNTRRVLIVGTGEHSLRYARLMRRNVRWGLELYGFLTTSPHEVGRKLFHRPVLDTTHALRQYLLTEVIDRVVFALPHSRLGEVAEHLRICEELGVDAVLIPQYAHLQIARMQVENFFGQPVINFTVTPQQTWQLVIKHLMDLLLSGMALIVLAPLFLVLGLLIKMDSPGPVFFSQQRSGLRGRTFNCLKFRTMYVDAEARLEELRKFNEVDGPVFKMKNDPRVTRIGRFLRKTSLDELPQLINVFRGDMSLVGPRPPLPAEVAQYEPWQRRRLSMKPGLTCTWQVSGRNEISFEQWMALDLEYIDQWNLALDIELILKTVPAMVRGTGV